MRKPQVNMFHIKTILKESQIHGIGIFTDQDIKKGELIYTQNNSLDLFISSQEFSNLSKNEQDTIKHYGYFDKKDKNWHLAFDDIRYCNHSKSPNITSSNKKLIAKRDIKKGEELTQDYSEFEDIRESLR